MGNWANATSQGLAVGKTIAGVRTVFETASSYTADFFDGHCSFIGVTDESFADQIIVRGSVENNKMSRIFIKTIDGVMRIVGATVINALGEVAPVTSAVKGKEDISAFVDKIPDLDFDLKGIIVTWDESYILFFKFPFNYTGDILYVIRFWAWIW